MNIKRLIGFVMIAVGIYLIFFAMHAMHQIHAAKGFIDNMQDFFTKNPTWNPIITFFGGKAREKVSSYDLPALLTLIAGIALTVSGLVVSIFAKKKKEKKR